jgi:hypothetical protein
VCGGAARDKAGIRFRKNSETVKPVTLFIRGFHHYGDYARAGGAAGTTALLVQTKTEKNTTKN